MKNIENSSVALTNNGGSMGLLDFTSTAKELAYAEDMRSRVNVARALHRARIQHGFTQTELGKAAGSKQSRISEIEALSGNPRLDTLDRIARVLGLMVTLAPRVAPEPEKPLTQPVFSLEVDAIKIGAGGSTSGQIVVATVSPSKDWTLAYG